MLDLRLGSKFAYLVFALIWWLVFALNYFLPFPQVIRKWTAVSHFQQVKNSLTMVFPYWLFTCPCAECCFSSLSPHSLSNATAFKNVSHLFHLPLPRWWRQVKSSSIKGIHEQNMNGRCGSSYNSNKKNIRSSFGDWGEQSLGTHLQWEIIPSWDPAWCLHTDSKSSLKINGLLSLFPLMFSFYLLIPFEIGNDCKSLLATESVFQEQWFDSCNLIY